MKITVMQVIIEIRNQFAIILWNFTLQICINKTGNPAKCRKVGHTLYINGILRMQAFTCILGFIRTFVGKNKTMQFENQVFIELFSPKIALNCPYNSVFFRFFSVEILSLPGR